MQLKVRESLGHLQNQFNSPADDQKFGTFAGDFVPTILTILGVIMYLRLYHRLSRFFLEIERRWAGSHGSSIEPRVIIGPGITRPGIADRSARITYSGGRKKMKSKARARNNNATRAGKITSTTLQKVLTPFYRFISPALISTAISSAIFFSPFIL